MTNTPILGIDLGTTNSLAAVVDDAGTRVIGGKAAITPSVVAILPDGRTVVGERAKAMAIQTPERVIHSVKRLIGRAVSEVRIEATRLHYNIVETTAGLARVRVPLDGEDGRPAFRDYSPEEISAMILGEVWRKAVAELGGDRDAWRRIVLTVPAYFDEPQRQATKQAAQIAGLEVVRLVNEPTAASLAYGLGNRGDGKVLVYDLGGGTFDVSILSIQQGTFRVLSTHGDTQLGGDDFDRGILELILTRIKEATGADLGHDPNVLATLRQSAESIKIRLSEHDSATLEIDVGSGEPLSLTVTRDDFEQLIAPHLDRTLASVVSALGDAELTPADIDEVVLVGGSTRIPSLRKRLTEKFGREPHTEIDPDLAVALGAARQGSVLSGDERDVLLLDVIPLSLGLETIGGTFSKLILRNATVPCSVTEEFSTQVDNQTGIDINLYQGERELVADCRPIGAFKLTGLPPMKAGLPRVAVTFTVNADGLLRVTARELRSGQTASVEVRPTLGLSDDEVNAIVAESIEQAGPDIVARESIELRNKARAVADGTARILAKGGAEGLAPEQRYAIQKALAKVVKLLDDGNDMPALDTALEKLSSLTMQLADDMIGASVRKALAGSDGGIDGR